MATPLPVVRLGFQTKLLVPVIVTLVLLVGCTLWQVNRRIRDEFRAIAGRNLITADEVLQSSQKIRINSLLAQLRHIPNEPRFKAVAQLGDEPTLGALLTELLSELGVDAVVFVDATGNTVSAVARQPMFEMAKFTAASVPAVAAAARDNAPVADLISLHRRFYDTLAIPSRVGERMLGVLVVGIEMGNSVALEFKQLTGTEVVFVVEGEIGASTYEGELPSLEQFIARPDSRLPARDDEDSFQEFSLNGERFLSTSDEFTTLDERGNFRYILLSSLEESLNVLRLTERWIGWIGLVGIALSGMILWIVIRQLTRPLRELRDAAELISDGDLSVRIPIRGRDECGEMAGAFNQMVVTLDASHTRQEQARDRLEIAVQELESFSYSVAHDLRSPLRGIDGWCYALAEDCAAQLDVTGREHLSRIRGEAQRMSLIIDYLLDLAHVNRATMSSVPFDLSSSVDRILTRLQATEPARIIESVVAPKLVTQGDTVLLELLLQNLLSNAWKFTGKRTEARIEFGSSETPDDPVFYVRDNGAGFDMSFAPKLFSPFNRLHKPSEFPGSGIGLSIVERIVRRHGGRVWAESVVNEGTTFYFTLNESNPGRTKGIHACHRRTWLKGRNYRVGCSTAALR